MAQESHLHDALKTIVATFGDQLYNDPKLINYISDYYRFDPMALYHVMKTLVHDGYPGRMLHEGKHGDWKLFVQQSMAKVQKQYGFAPSYVNYCFQSLAYGIGLTLWRQFLCSPIFFLQEEHNFTKACNQTQASDANPTETTMAA